MNEKEQKELEEKLVQEKEASTKAALAEHERLSKLFKEKPLMFEIERKQKIEALINTARTEEEKARLREMQATWDKTMKGAGNKHNRLVLAEKMLMEHFREKFVPAINDLNEAVAAVNKTLNDNEDKPRK